MKDFDSTIRAIQNVVTLVGEQQARWAWHAR
jgi:hypothetical protein